MKKELRDRVKPSKVLAVCLLASMSACSTSTILGHPEVTLSGTPEGLNSLTDMFTGLIVQSKRQDAQGDDVHHELRRLQTKYRGLRYYKQQSQGKREGHE